MENNFSVKRFIKLEYFLLLVVLVIPFINVVFGSMAVFFYVAFLLVKNIDSAANFIGDYTFNKKHYSKALKWYKFAAKSNNSKLKYINNYIFIELKYGSIKKAKEVLTYIENNRDFQGEDLIDFKITESLIEYKNNNLEKSINILEPLCKKSQSASLYGALGYLLNYGKDSKKALIFNQDSLELEPNNILIKFNLAKSCYRNNQLDKSKLLLNQIISLNPNFSDPYIYLGMILKKEGKLEDSLKMIDKAHTLPESSVAYIAKNK